MPALNKVMIMGNLGADPEMRFTANGNAVTNFNVAVNESWTDQQGERKERTEWFTVVTWNKTAENCAKYLAKGSSVFVEGRLQTRSWDHTDGTKRYRTEVVGDRVNFISGTRDASADEAYQPTDEDLPFAYREPFEVSACERAYRPERWSV